ECIKILTNCRAAMTPKGKVLVADNVIAPGNDPGWGKLLDIQMLIIGGRERNKEEFAALFKAAGLRLTRIVPTKCPLSVVEGIRAYPRASSASPFVQDVVPQTRRNWGRTHRPRQAEWG